MGEDDNVTNAVLAERIKFLNNRLDKIEKAISFVQWGVGAAVLTSLMKLLGLG